MPQQVNTMAEASGQSNCGPRWWAVVIVAVLALAMGWPALSGGFLGGDDIQLARDHVLVNRPSPAHVIELFRIVHRDLYQPVALLSLAGDFAIARAAPVSASVSPEAAAASVAHLTNLLLHVANAVLVLLLVQRVGRAPVIALATAVLFAVHPLHVECVAWISGRMMLLSSFFILAALLLLERWSERGGIARAAFALLLIALAMMSKVRVELPLLLLIPALYRRAWPPRRWWAVWGMASALTVGFAALNLYASRGMIARGEEFLSGPRAVRTVLALAWYISRAVWPVGLSPFHPTPQVVTWAQPGLLAACVIVLVVAAAALVSARRTRGIWCGLVWFLAAIAVTLPIIPARNLAVAERYAYLPDVGLLAAIATAVVAGFGAAFARFSRSFRATAAGASALAVVAALLVLSWRTAPHYHDDVQRAGRVAARYPMYPESGLRYAWTLHEAGRYTDAITVAQDVERRHGAAARAEALEVVGSSRLRLHDAAAALAALREATVLAPDDGRAWSKLGAALAETGDTAGALDAYERVVKLLPNQNPDLLRLARLYRQTERTGDAARVYAQVLVNNPFDVTASLSLAELDIAEGRHEAALARLRTLLAWMPENGNARIDAGVSLAALKKTTEAVDEFLAASDVDARAFQEWLNAAGNFDMLAALLQSRADAAPSDPWPYVLLARACAWTGRPELARLAAEECRKRTRDPAILGRLSGGGADSP
jgi:Flp pilus assembly protein TadD